ncbi:MAG: hypothetical protein ACM3WQ_00280 [Chloroflexota bacterium]|nr:hypothetical protein [Candidatus Sulfotelmatobacter sp.]
MSQYTIQSVTVLAIIVISIILAIYLVILKRMGWLDRSNQFYRCPNQECKKLFQKPAEVKDLSQVPSRIYYACPECGTDLKPYLTSNSTKKTEIKTKPTSNQNVPQTESLERKIGTKQYTEPKQVPKKEQPIKMNPNLNLTIIQNSRQSTSRLDCRYYFGYLSSRGKHEVVPELCLECSKCLDCMHLEDKPKDSFERFKIARSPISD